MSAAKSARGWWVAAVLSAPLLVLLDRFLQGRLSPQAEGIRFGALLLLLFLVPALFGAAALRRERTTGAADPRVVQAIQETVQARQAVQSALAALAQARPAAPSAPAPVKSPRRVLPIVVGLLILLVGSGGLAYAFLHVPDENVPDSTFHVHATFAVYVRNERVNYSSEAFDLETRSFLVSHLHTLTSEARPVPDQDLLHVELLAGQRLGDVLDRATGTRLGRDVLTLDEAVHGGATYRAEGEERLRVLVAHDLGDDWQEIEDGPAYRILNGDRILITFGAPDDAALAAQKDSVARRTS